VSNAVEGFPPVTRETVSLGGEPTIRRVGFGAVRSSGDGLFRTMFHTDSPFTIGREDDDCP
jgi:hypothetical protein